MGKLVVFTGNLGPLEAGLSIQGVNICKAPEHEDTYAGFIRRTNWMKKAATSRADTWIVERRHLRMEPGRQRMLARVALGLGVEVRGGEWCGLAPMQYGSNEGPGIGCWDGRVLVVGDAPNVNAPEGAPNWPFISSSEDGCAAWFADLLHESGVPETALYWINSSVRRGRAIVPQDPAVLKSRDWDAVVTLGRPAKIWAASADLPNIQEGYHPVYWWSHRSCQPYNVIKYLQEATIV